MSGFKYWRQFVSHVLCIQSVHWHSYFRKWPMSSGIANFISRETVCEKTIHLHQLFHQEQSLKQFVKVSMLCGPTCTTLSSLVTNLVPFWRLLTYQSTILHCYLSAHARCATWLPVQHDIRCNIKQDNCGSGGQKLTNFIFSLCPWLTAMNPWHCALTVTYTLYSMIACLLLMECPNTNCNKQTP